MKGSIAPLLNLIIGQVSNLVTVYDRTSNQSPEQRQSARDIAFSGFVLRLQFLAGLAACSFLFGFLQTFCWSVAAERQTKVTDILESETKT